MNGPVQAMLDEGTRLHLQHGPIDLILGADPIPGGDRALAFRAAARRFETILEELVAELPLLRSAATPRSPVPKGAVARRMDKAVRSFMPQFITPMAAVAGSVADEVLAAMQAVTALARGYVNNGGDISLHLEVGQQFSLAMARLDGVDLGRIMVAAGQGVGGIATSGRGGRSLSMGIADSVTVLAADAALADAAATLIGNAVDLPGHPAVTHRPANEINPDSDLGTRAVVTHVATLTAADVNAALNRGAALAEDYRSQGMILGAALFLRGGSRLVGQVAENRHRSMTHA